MPLSRPEAERAAERAQALLGDLVEELQGERSGRRLRRLALAAAVLLVELAADVVD
jgi:hypothetical protein